ncbi:MAG: hypothetical protein ACK4M4_01730 [Flavobacterium sp.]
MAAFFYLFGSEVDFSSSQKLFVFAQVLVTTVLLPIVAFYLLRITGQIQTIMAKGIGERKIPLVLHCFLLLLLIKKTITIAQYPEFHFFLLGGLLSSLIALLLLFIRVKASLHLVGISSLTVFVIGCSMHFQNQYTILIALLIVMNGMVASSRLEMNAHTYKELLIGFFIGSIPQLLLLNLWL